MFPSFIKNRINAIRLNVREKLNPYFAHIRVRKLTSTDFSIISNNCWGGHVYRYFGLPYNSPTIGLYFFAAEYVSFLKDLKGFLSSEMQIIPVEQSKYYNELKKRKEEDVPIGRILYANKTVEVVFLHYHSPEEALQKWNRRKKRVNFNNLVVKNSFQNLCTEREIEDFDRMNFEKKIFFVPQPMNKYKSTRYFRGWESKGEIANDTIDFRRYVNLVELINGGY